METVYEYLTAVEAEGQRAFLQAYREEYTRLYKPGYSEDGERLVYWSELAHRAGCIARNRVLSAYEPASV